MADSTSALAVRHNAPGAINGSYFDVRKLIPATFVIDDGHQDGNPVKDRVPFRTL